ncbi:glycosyltransferase involved in cell wall biosynthesis [Azospirillum agricola]|uniref:glycosyltransferase family 4 protein n=1 Tax=Azospirillum agricola TaxID=1720247 RepID=UPI001AE6A2F8|nr:glycosyltransferase family 4 protein [Azospirillum agricola]MBP2232945.1 glycosyltransferase involved in cell wall biosynthesis [Azospirillum agricola]
MRILFVHQNTPGQYKHLVRRFAADPAHQVAFIGKVQRGMPGVRSVVYRPAREPGSATHPYINLFEGQILHGQGAVRAGLALQKEGFTPDVICAHPGWGEALFLKDVFPDAKLMLYCEFFYRADGSDVGFDPEKPVTLDTRCRIRAKNAALLAGLEAADWGVSPTEWQRRQHPAVFRPRISVVHDGVDTALCRPDAAATVTLPGGRVLSRADEVVTYVARNLEPYRGFPTFMRAAADLLRRRPNTHILVVGGDEVSYGTKPAEGGTWREQLTAETRPDPERIHFLGKIPYDAFLSVLRISRAHVYLTYPFVLSWSMLEAMACGAVIVGSDTPPVAEVIEDGRNGLLVDFFDAKVVADRMEEALDDPGRMAGISAAARRTVVERFDLETVCLPAQIHLLEDLYAGRLPPLSQA